MDFCFQSLSQSSSLIIADEWKYNGEYAFYDMTADPEDYEEFTNEASRNTNDYYEAIADGRLAGFFCVIPDSSSLEIGLGLRPDLCGHGVGREFLHQILDYITEHYSFTELKLDVAAFNARAIKLYSSCGFSVSRSFKQSTNGGVYDFLEMTMAGHP